MQICSLFIFLILWGLYATFLRLQHGVYIAMRLASSVQRKYFLIWVMCLKLKIDQGYFLTCILTKLLVIVCYFHFYSRKELFFLHSRWSSNTLLLYQSMYCIKTELILYKGRQERKIAMEWHLKVYSFCTLQWWDGNNR